MSQLQQPAADVSPRVHIRQQCAITGTCVARLLSPWANGNNGLRSTPCIANSRKMTAGYASASDNSALEAVAGDTVSCPVRQ